MRIAIATLAVAAALAAASAGATQQRSFVASNGNDSNLCTLAAPCRPFGAAIAQTNDGGEVIVLDSAGYGKVTITKSVSIVAPAGVYAGISVFAPDDGITVNAPSQSVTLRGLSINGQGGTTGIAIAAAARVNIESCEISGMAGNGIAINGGDLVTVVDTTVRENHGTGIGASASSTLVLDNVRSNANDYDGFYLNGGGGAAYASISNSVFSYNGNDGIWANAAGGSYVWVTADRTASFGNGHTGARASNGARLVATHGYITNNFANDLQQESLAILYTTQTNTAQFVAGTLSPFPLK